MHFMLSLRVVKQNRTYVTAMIILKKLQFFFLSHLGILYYKLVLFDDFFFSSELYLMCM